MSDLSLQLQEKIDNKEAKIGIVGMGYVGIPLGLAFCKKGFEVLGFDKDKKKVDDLNGGKQVMKHISKEEMEVFVKNGCSATGNFEEIQNLDCIIICVPTPLDVHQQPDMSYVKAASNMISSYLQEGQLVVLESTTYPGTTNELVRPILEKSNLVAGEDFFLAYSPEREDPGNENYDVSKIPKVMGGYTKNCLENTKKLYMNIVQETVEVSSMEAAESTKLLENIFRSVNIAMVNELKLIFSRMDVNIWEVIEAAKTKPFGFMPFYPGPGIGGHCIPIDPFYLSWKAKEYNTEAKFIELAGEINRKMTENIAHRIGKGLNDDAKSIRDSNILILGIAYKKDIDDFRESPAIPIMNLLKFKGANVSYHDPHIDEFNKHKSVELSAENVMKYDAVVIITDHSEIDYNLIAQNSNLIIDTRNVMANIIEPKARILRA